MSGPRARSNGRSASSRMTYLGLRLAFVLGKAAQVLHGQGQFEPVGDHLARDPALGDQRGAQHFVSAHDLVQGPLEGRDVEPARA